MYTFHPGQEIAIVHDSGVIAAVLQVESVDGGIVCLQDGSLWYSSGLPVQPPADRRITAMVPALATQIERKRKLCALAELATIVRELADRYGTVSDSSLAVAEAALLRAVEGYVATLPVADRASYLRRLQARLQSARETPIETFRHTLRLAPSSKGG